MKKITTNGRSFGTAQSLSRQQLKNVMGGVSTINTTPYCDTKDCEYAADVRYPNIKTKSKCQTKTGPGPQTNCSCGTYYVTKDCERTITV